MKINFAKVYNDFGAALPADYSDFYNDLSNEVTSQDLRAHYLINNKYRAYEAFKKEFADYVASLKEAKSEAK